MKLVNQVEDTCATSSDGVKPTSTFWLSVVAEAALLLPGGKVGSLQRHYIELTADLTKNVSAGEFDAFAGKLKVKGWHLGMWSAEAYVTLVILVKKVASYSTTGAFREKAEATNEFPGRRAKAMYQRYYVLFTDLKKNLPAAQFGALGLTVRGHLFL